MFHRNEINADTKACYTELYDRTQKVHYRIGGRDDKLSLNLKVSLVVRYGFSDEKVLKVVITDSSNPMLLFSTEIDCDVYAKLKQKLGLLIDFSQFPRQLVSLLEQCAGDGDVTASKYALALEEVSADPYDLVEGQCILLRVFEANQFQRLCLVALHLVSGSEAEVNAFMARSIQTLKQQLESMRLKAREAEERAAEAVENAGAKNFELERLKAQFDEQLKAMRRDGAEEGAELKRRAELMKEEFERKMKKVARDVEERERQQQARLQDELERCRAEIGALKTANGRMEAELAERNDGLDKLHHDMKILQDEILKSENKVARLEAEAKEKQAVIGSLKQRLATADKDREEKDKAARKLTALLEAADSQKAVLKAALKEKLQTVETQKADLSLLTKDLMKANEIIAKLNDEGKQLKAKLKERSKIALQQEKVIGELQSRASSVDSAMREQRERLHELKEENSKLQALLKASEEIVQQKEEIIRKNKRVIGWLNESVARQGAKTAANATSGLLTAAAPDPTLVDRKLLQLTTGSADGSKTNLGCRKPAGKTQQMRGK